jgi:hypothetical protein
MRTTKQQPTPSGEAQDFIAHHKSREGKDWHLVTYRVDMPPYWPNQGFFPSERDMHNIAQVVESHEPNQVACVLLHLALNGGIAGMHPDERMVVEDLISLFIYMNGVEDGWLPSEEKK